MTVDINYVAVLVAAVLSMVLGGLWYSPLLFGKLWIDLMGVSPSEMKEMKKKAKPAYLFNFLALLLMAYVLAHFVDYVQATTILEGFQAGFWAWLGFIATVTLGSVLWERKPFRLYLLNNAYYMVSMVLMGGLLAVWA